ncbi:arrestin-related trafficking adapter [Fusarium mundagurra]|uniref:Arrestin-related trafficking adapter n=1 Tax=Fusarium mundagurra TaxID=1567541 RepID=A0A8H6D4B8_9HYPO|nr:arrestin-related trafficking adapter [Fusarium mundagurra]
MSIQSVEFAVASLFPKPVISGSDVTCFILLAEHNIFLSGFDRNGNGHREGQSGAALLRGELQLHVSKNVKIKAVRLKLLGRARTEWPEGMKLGYYEEEVLQTQVLTFFDAINIEWKYDYGNQCAYRLKNTHPNNTNLATQPNQPKSLTSHYHSNTSVKETSRFPLQSVQWRNVNKNNLIATSKVKGYRVFYPGTYNYSFELPIDHHQLETTKVQYGSVKWELHVSRQYLDQLHYDIIISEKSFPIGSKVPIALKLMPLAKIQAHELKVFVMESIEYWSNDKRCTRKASGRKILLLNKTARKTLDPSWAPSNLRIVRGSELILEKRREGRETAAKQRTTEASRRHSAVQPLLEPSNNFLCDLNLGLESLCCPTEIEVDLQIPTCDMMAKKDLRLHPECIWKKVMMRISRLDTKGPMGTKGRNFEIATKLPFTLLNCRATSANINLPFYSDEMSQSTTYQSTCGCPDALTIRTETSPQSFLGTMASTQPSAGTAGVHGPSRTSYPLRVPIFNPPAFESNVAPPPAPESVDETPEMGVMTPPPRYDDVVGTFSVNGLVVTFPA